MKLCLKYFAYWKNSPSLAEPSKASAEHSLIFAGMEKHEKFFPYGDRYMAEPTCIGSYKETIKQNLHAEILTSPCSAHLIKLVREQDPPQFLVSLTLTLS